MARLSIPAPLVASSEAVNMAAARRRVVRSGQAEGSKKAVYGNINKPQTGTPMYAVTQSSNRNIDVGGQSAYKPVTQQTMNGAIIDEIKAQLPKS